MQAEQGERPAHGEQRGGHQIGIRDPERIPEQELLEPLRGVGRQRQEGTEPHQAGDHHARPGLGADPLVPAGHGDQAGRHEHADPAAEQQRGAGQRREHEAGEQPVGQRLRCVPEPLGGHPEAEGAAHRAEQHHLEQRAPADAGAERVE